jgi:hypothetical protein
MLVRQVEEAALGHGELKVEAARDRAYRDLARERIGRERTGAAAKHVARELVDHDEQGEYAFGGVVPGEGARRRCLVGREKPGADLVVERGVLGEPFVRSSGAPEGEHVCNRRSGHSLIFPSMSS